MARVVKEKEYAVKRNDILDVAQRLIYTKGYGQMSIQDVVDALKISKGAFYHYFDSKPALLEAMIERLQVESEGIVAPIVNDDRLPTLKKLHRLFHTISQWKTDQREFLLALLKIWYTDDNALVRQKMTAMMIQKVSPWLARIIRQGVDEGVLMAPHPERVAEVVLVLMVGLGDAVARRIFALADDQTSAQRSANIRAAEEMLAVYTDAVERILGAPQGSLELMDLPTLKKWFVPQEDQVVPNSTSSKKR